MSFSSAGVLASARALPAFTALGFALLTMPPPPPPGAREAAAAAASVVGWVVSACFLPNSFLPATVWLAGGRLRRTMTGEGTTPTVGVGEGSRRREEGTPTRERREEGGEGKGGEGGGEGG